MTRLRIDDIVEHVKCKGRLGRIWELRHSGRVSVYWNDEVMIAKAGKWTFHVSYRRRHYAAKNLRVVKP